MKIWREDGTIVYSDEPRLIGEQFTLGEDERAVLTSGEQGAEVSDLTKPENRFEPESKLLEVYLRTETPSGTPLLFEAYFRYSGVTDVGRHLWAQFAPITIGALVVLLLMQIPLAWSMARRLQSSQLERERLLRHALDASDAERRRIASDLHDGVVQELTGVSLALAAQGRSESIGRSRCPRRILGHPLQHQVAAVAAGRDLPTEPAGGRTPVGDRRSAQRTHGEGNRDTPRRRHGRHGRRCRVRCARLPRRAGGTAQRGDSLRGHARACAADRRRSGSVRLVVDDNGRGFSTDMLDERAAGGHVGLRSLAGLVADLGGALDVRSAPGEGTRVEVSIPIDARARR